MSRRRRRVAHGNCTDPPLSKAYAMPPFLAPAALTASPLALAGQTLDNFLRQPDAWAAAATLIALSLFIVVAARRV